MPRSKAPTASSSTFEDAGNGSSFTRSRSTRGNGKRGAELEARARAEGRLRARAPRVRGGKDLASSHAGRLIFPRLGTGPHVAKAATVGSHPGGRSEGEDEDMARPQDLKYAKSHEWVRVEGDTIRVGITDYAVEQLSDLAFVDLPEVGDR